MPSRFPLLQSGDVLCQIELAIVRRSLFFSFFLVFIRNNYFSFFCCLAYSGFVNPNAQTTTGGSVITTNGSG